MIIVSAAFAACNGNKQQAADARRDVIDSMNQVNSVSAARERTIDSMQQLQAAESQQMAHHYVHHTGGTQSNATANQGAATAPSTEGQTAAAPAKKGMNNTTKGALIGGGAGAVTGAAAGALIDGKHGEGAIVGGLIGSVVGAGVGAVSGHAVDKKKAKTTSTTGQ